MKDSTDLGLPIEKQKISGPAVKALAERKESNDSLRASVEVFKQSYRTMRESLLSGLKMLGSIKP